MVSASTTLYYAFHPQELRSIVQWKLYHDPVHQRDKEKESESVSRCYFLLEMTSRSFSSVIQELHPELKLPVAIFYLILRALDTVEDDMTLPLEKKDSLLRDFHNVIEIEGWTFNDSGPDEPDRELLVQFDVVVKEFRACKLEYRTIIADITKKMGNGMADFANNAEHDMNGVNTVKEYDLYCHYVAGLVGEGLTRLFVESKLGNPLLLDRPYLHESMGLFLQKVNVIRDVREDWDGKRRFWPKEIWSKHVQNFDDLFKPENREKALDCSTEMVLNALQHAEECLFYLAGLKEQSVFNFCAIPQTMAIATLELVFQNTSLFDRNVKITKGQACQLMIESSQNLRVVSEVFRKYSHKILRKNKPKDPNFFKMSMTCAKLEKFINGLFPKPDPKVAAGVGGTITEAEKHSKATVNAAEISASEKAAQDEAKWDLIYMGIAVALTLLFISSIMIGIAWYFGARFSGASTAFANKSLPASVLENARETVRQHGHGEL